MHNELTFLIHGTAVLLFLFGALYLGKETLITFIACSWIFANFFVTKQITLLGFEVTASDVYAIGAMLGMSVLQEFWGRKIAVLSIWTSFFTLLLATGMSYLHLNYIPTLHDTTHSHFEALLGSTPRLMVASFATFFISSRLEVALFNLLRQWVSLPFPVRSGISIASILLFDTILFSYLGLYGIVANLFDVCLVSYIVKLLVIISLAPFLTLVRYVFQPTQLNPLRID